MNGLFPSVECCQSSLSHIKRDSQGEPTWRTFFCVPLTEEPGCVSADVSTVLPCCVCGLCIAESLTSLLSVSLETVQVLHVYLKSVLTFLTVSKGPSCSSGSLFLALALSVSPVFTAGSVQQLF